MPHPWPVWFENEPQSHTTGSKIQWPEHHRQCLRISAIINIFVISIGYSCLDKTPAPAQRSFDDFSAAVRPSRQWSLMASRRLTRPPRSCALPPLRWSRRRFRRLTRPRRTNRIVRPWCRPRTTWACRRIVQHRRRNRRARTHDLPFRNHLDPKNSTTPCQGIERNRRA